MKMYVASLVAALAVLFCGVTTGWAQNQAPAAATEEIIVTTGSGGAEEAEITVLGIDTSLKASFWLDSIPGLKTDFQGTPLWQYLAFFVYLALAYVMARILTFILSIFFRKWFSSKSRVMEMAFSTLIKPTRLILFVVFLSVGLELYQWPAWIAGALAKLFMLAVATSVTYAIAKLIDVVFSVWKEKTSADTTFTEQIIPLFNRIAKYIVVFIGILTVASNLGINVTSVLALGSVGGLAVGLATQDLLNNVFGGIVVFLDKPFRLGDRITVEGREGMVETIGLRSTRIRTLEGFLLTVPNKTICNSLITNVTSRPTIKTEINIGVTYDTTVEELKKAIDITTDVYKNNERTADCVVNFNKFGDFALNIQVIHWHKPDDWAKYVKTLEAMNLELKRRFDAEKINFAFPTQTLYMKQDSAWQVSQGK